MHNILPDVFGVSVPRNFWMALGLGSLPALEIRSIDHLHQFQTTALPGSTLSFV
jgi:hypothetical protein